MKSLLYFQLFDDIFTIADADIKSRGVLSTGISSEY